MIAIIYYKAKFKAYGQDEKIPDYADWTQAYSLPLCQSCEVI